MRTSFRVRKWASAFVGVAVMMAMWSAVGGVAAAKAKQHQSHSTFRVADLTPGEQHDGSWGQAVNTGVLTAGKKYGVKVSLDDDLTGSSVYKAAGASYASKGYNLVIISNGSYPTVVKSLAKEFPKTWFCEFAVTIPNPPSNVCTITPTFYDGDFLAGALAAMVSTSGVVSEIGGFSFPVLNWEMNGFAYGARYINPKITVETDYVNTWTTVATTRSAAEAQITGGSDVIFSATDQATEGIYAAAEAHPHTYAVSQYFNTHSQAPSVVLTSVLFNLQGAGGNLIKYLHDGTLKNNNYVITFKQGAGKLAPFYGLAPSVVTKSISARLSKLEKWIASGKLVVPPMGTEKEGVTASLTKLPKPPA